MKITNRFISLALAIVLIISLAAPAFAADYYFPKYSGSGNSVVDMFNTWNIDSSFQNRSRVAAANNIQGYEGTSEQNLAMVALGRSGLLINPDAKAEESKIDYTCSAYDECTINGAQIFIITKDNCAIRKEAHNKGEIVARGKLGQLVSVNRVFQTEKNTRWCEINVIGSNEKLYCFIENCTPHSEHSYINILTTDNGYVDFCAVCGVAKAVAEKQTVTCGLTCIGDQAVKGSFSSYDPTLESVIAQIIVGEIPGVGTLADARDLVGDIMNGESAWIIAADIAALLPLIGAVKYADELSIIAKNSDELSNGIKYSDEAASVAKRSNNIHWGKWEDYKKVRVNGKEYAQIGDYKYTEHAVSEFLNPSIQTNQIKGVEHSRGVPPSYVNWILTEGRKLGTTKIVEERIVNGAKRVTYANGTLCVSVENGDTVITIFTK